MGSSQPLSDLDRSGNQSFWQSNTLAPVVLAIETHAMIRSCSAIALQLHRSCVAIALQLHRSCVAIALQLHCSCVAIALQLHRSCS